jgi:hypothetical protein
MKTLKPAIMGAVLAAALAAPLLVQHRADVRWRVQRQASRQQAVSLDQLSAENERLSNVVARVKSSQSLSDAQLTELLKLRNEAGQLRRALMEINTLRDRVHRLHDRLEDAAKEEEGRDNYTAQLADEMPKRQARVARLRQWLEGMPAEKIPSIRQRKFRRQFAHAGADFVRGLDVFDVQQHFGNHVRNGRHLRFLHAARRHRRRAQPDAAGLERRAGLERNRVFVDRDAGFVERIWQSLPVTFSRPRPRASDDCPCRR